MPSKFRIKTRRGEIGALLEKPARTLKGRAEQALKALQQGKAVLLKESVSPKMKGAELSPAEVKAGRVVEPRPKRRPGRRKKK